jgi:MFS transporter, YNFM family, putative membrane transport protein
MTILADADRGAATPCERASLRAAIVALTAFLTVVDLFATQAILPTLAQAYEVTPAAMSLAVNASTLGMAVSSLATALVAQRVDRRRGVIAGLVLLSIPTLLLAVAPNLWVFAGLRVAQGLCMAAAFTLTLAYLGERFMASEAAGAFAAYITGNVASNLFGRLMSAGLADHFGLATNFVVFAMLNLAGAGLVASSMRRLSAADRAAGTASPLLTILGHLRDRRLAAAFAIGFCILFAFIGTFTFVNFVLVAPPLALGMMSVGLVYLVFLPSIPTTLCAGAIVRRVGSRRALWLGLGLAAAGLPLLLSNAIAPVLAGLCLVAIGTFFAQAVTTGFVGRTAKSERGAASGLYLGAYFTGGLAGTALLGLAFDRAGWPACVAGIALALLVATLLAIRLRD